jgi:hypothetical protein
MTTAAFYGITRTEVKFQVYYGVSGQETVYIDRATFDSICLQNGASTLATYNDLRGTQSPVAKGEKSVKVPAYVKKVRRYDDAISGETVSETIRSPRTIAMFIR